MNFRRLLFALTSFMSFLVLGQDENWKEKYTLVRQDIKEVNLIKKKDIFLTLRLFQLHSEKLNLLLDAESALMLKLLDQESAAQKENLKKIRELIKTDQIEIEKISNELKNKTKDPAIFTQMYYFKGLNYYSLKKHKEFESNFKIAETYCKNHVVCPKIKVKLADYYYNEGLFSEAIKYYLQVIKLDSAWLSKIHFNLAWSYFKNNKFEEALLNLKRAKTLSDNPKYYPAGKQLNKSITFFYAYIKRPQEGLRYLREVKMYNFDNLYQYANDTFEYGVKESLPLIFEELEKSEKNPDQEVKLITQKIAFLRNIKLYDQIQTMIVQKNSDFPFDSKIADENKQELISTLLDYNGFLQELLNSREKINTVSPEKLITSIKDNLLFLRKFHPASTLKYHFYEGEAQYSLKNFQFATLAYLDGIKTLKNSKKAKINRSSEEQMYLSRSFDSLFKSLEYFKNDKTTSLVFKYYLYFFPNHPQAKEIYRRLVNLNINSDAPLSTLLVLKKVSKQFPKDLIFQQDALKRLISKFAANKDVNNLKKIRPFIEQDFLSSKSELLDSINETISSIELNIVEENFDKRSPRESLAALDHLRKKNKGLYDIEYRILLKKLSFAHERNLYPQMSFLLDDTLQTLRDPEKLKFNTNLNFYLNQTCLNSSINSCHDIIQNFRRFKITLNEENDTLNFRTAIALKKFKYALEHANTSSRQDYFLKSLMLEYPLGESDVFNQLSQQSKEALSFLLEQKFWRIYFATHDIDKTAYELEKIKVPEIKQKITKIVSNYKNSKSKISLVLPTPPTTLNGQEITFEAFSKFLQNFAKDFEVQFSAMDLAIKDFHPNLIPEYVKVINNVINENLPKYQNYIPSTGNSGLKNAIIGEMSKIITLLAQKKELYNKLAAKASKKTSLNMERQLFSSENSYSDSFKEALIWESL